MEFDINLKSGTGTAALAIVVAYHKTFEGHRFVYSTGIKVDREPFKAGKRGKALNAVLKACEEAYKLMTEEGAVINNKSLKARIQLVRDRMAWVDDELHIYDGKKIERHTIPISVNREKLTGNIQLQLQKGRANVKNVIDYAVSDGASELFGFWNSVLDGKIKTRGGKKLRASTVIAKRQTLKILQAYRPDARFDAMDRKFYNDFTTSMREKGLDENTIGRHIKELKSVLHLAAANELTTDLRFSYWPVVKLSNEAVPLSKEEILKIVDLDLTGTIADVRDIFIIACFCGARISDFKQFTKENVTVKAGITYISYVAQKTGTSVSVPINPIAVKIIDKHDGAFPKMIAEQNFRAYVKAIAKEAELNDRVVLKIRDGKPTYAKKWEAISPHSSRRTFASSLYYGWFGRPMPAALIMLYTGHKSEKSFMAYIGASNADIQKRALEYFDIQPQMKVS